VRDGKRKASHQSINQKKSKLTLLLLVKPRLLLSLLRSVELLPSNMLVATCLLWWGWWAWWGRAGRVGEIGELLVLLLALVVVLILSDWLLWVVGLLGFEF
jgi:hypothetical protein